MSFSERFDIGYLKIWAERGEEVFLSVTPLLRFGPGIQRDGLTPPRMTDPHTVEFVTSEVGRAWSRDDLPPTDNPYVQRAGTWTLFNHLKRFVDLHDATHRIISIQSCGDLSMNPWHVAFLNESAHHLNESAHQMMSYLHTAGDPQEPIHERTYRCLVKWKKGIRDYLYEFIDLKFADLSDKGYGVRIVDEEYLSHEKKEPWFDEKGVDPNNIAPHIDLALSGKPIVEKGRDIALANVIDRFQDARHVFNLPTVPAHGAIGGTPIEEINFGEYTLYNDLNARRGALHSPILVELQVPPRADLPPLRVAVRPEELLPLLEAKHHYKPSPGESPTRRGYYRMYSSTCVEIFFPHNVYPFGVLGGKQGHLVCLASGGLSGRVGNTLEGITRIMYDFFGCHDAIVLDEGYDTFHFVNPNIKEKETDPDNYRYENGELLNEVAAFSLWRANKDAEEGRASLETDLRKAQDSARRIYTKEFTLDIRNWPLNQRVFHELDEYCGKSGIEPSPPSALGSVAVKPRRSQVRSVIIFAVRRDQGEEASSKRASANV